MTIGHEAFWSTMAQLLVVVGGGSAYAFSKAARQLSGGSEPYSVAQRIAVLIVGTAVILGYLILEATTLFVLAGEASENASLRTQAILWLLALTIVSLLGPAYYIAYARTIKSAASTSQRVSGAAHSIIRAVASLARARIGHRR